MARKDKDKRNASTVWLERTNPLAGLSIRDAQAVFDTARFGDTHRLHWLFQEIEAANPVLLTCVERRAAAVAGFQWTISPRASHDRVLADEQRDAADRFFGGIDNLVELFEHLDLAFFRGFAHAQPLWESDGSVRHVELLDSWKFLRKDGVWYWDPACTGRPEESVDCTSAGLVSVIRRRPIDYPALSIHIRHAVGARDWGRFLERYALPKPAIFMHPGATEDQRALYLEGAEAVENGQPSVWPNGASLTDFAGNARGSDPFSAFVEHQQKQIVLLATGGTLMSLAESGTGTLAGNAQTDVWKSIVARDSSAIAKAVERTMLLPFLERCFPGRPAAVSFGFDFEEKPTPKEIFETAAAARSAGYIVNREELEEMTGFTLEKDESAFMSGASPFGSVTTPLQNVAKPLQNARSVSDGKTDASKAPSDSRAILDAFAKDTSAIADEIRVILEDPTPEKARALLDRLPELIPDDPAIATVIADAMAEEFALATEDAKKEENKEEDSFLLTQEEAERIYEEMMGLKDE